MDGDELALVPLAEASERDSAAEPLLLGIDAAGPLFALDLDARPAGR